MLAWLITWSLHHRYLVLLGSLLIVVSGVLSLRALNIDAFPDTTPVQVQINTVSPSLVPEEVERQITFPVELSLNGLPGLKQVRSLSQFGLSQVTVTFDDGTDIYFARQLINERLGTVELPPGIDRPEMGPVATGLGEVLHYLVKSDGLDLTDLRTYQNWKVRPEMRPVPGTAEINSWGGFEKQYQVRVDPLRLLKYDLGFAEVIRALRGNNLNVGGGNLVQTGEMLLIHGVGRTNTVEQIENIMITAREGTPIRIRDVAKVEAVGQTLRRGAVTADGQGEAILGLGFMLMGENSYTVTHRLRDKLEEVKKDTPVGGRIETVYDRTELVDQVIETVRDNLLEGGLLVVTLLYILLGNLRAGLIVATAIPLSMLFAFNGMLQFGIAGTLLSLGAIDFGIVVDSSVVVVENVIRHVAHGETAHKSREEVVRDAAIEVRKPTVFGQLIIMIVYIPILTLEGVEGKMFRPMALTVVFVLIGSLILSLTLMPVLAYMFLPKRMEEKDVWLIRLARWLYTPFLRLAMRLRWATVGLAACLLLLAGLIALGMGSEFVPRLSEGAVVIGLLRMPGTSLEESTHLNTQIEKMLLQRFPDEIEHVWSRTGSPEVATDAGSVEETDMFVTLKPREKWTAKNKDGKRVATQDELVALMETAVDDIPGQLVAFTQPIEQRINEMISGARSDIALKLYGENFATLVSKGQELESVLREIDGCADLSHKQIAGLPILRVRIKQDQIARYGVSAEAVLDLIESLGGKVVGNVIEGQLPFPLLVRLPDEMRQSPESIASIPVATASGERIPLSRLAEVKVEKGPKIVFREWSKRYLTIQANVRGRDIGSFVAEAREKIAEKVELPDGYRLDWGGQFENMERAQKRLMIVVPAALAMIVVLLYLTYRNVVDTAFVFASVPFACVGGVLTLWARGMPISVSAAVGFITLSGVSVLNGMILVSFLRNLLNEGLPAWTAVEKSCRTCLRTVLMTALVASVGFIPMATSTGMGAEVQRPLATVVIGGVITSTVFTLFVLPVLYLFGRSRDVSGAAVASAD
ncbi:MAG TPA: CusA/CzcA family heavy metal efflux RND transporter [Gemmataceae bacterium]|jgi:cobalt-zinc-cadmium resistance protein CzcA